MSANYSYQGKDVSINSNFSFKEMRSAGKPAAKKALYKLALQIEGQAVLLTPVDKGRLRDSITYSIEGQGDSVRGNAQGGDGVNVSREPLTAVVGTNVNYAPFQEFGTAKQGYAQPFLRPAFDLVTGTRTRKEVKDALNEALKQKGIKSK